jgi:hypothetical protein
MRITGTEESPLLRILCPFCKLQHNVKLKSVHVIFKQHLPKVCPVAQALRVQHPPVDRCDAVDSPSSSNVLP